MPIRPRRPVRYAHSVCFGDVTWSCGQDRQNFSANKVLERLTLVLPTKSGCIFFMTASV